jgi:hypothetical protein
LESGIFLPGNGKAMVQLEGKNGVCLLAGSQNRGPLKIFRLKQTAKTYPVLPNDVSATIFFADGRKQKQELYFGASFLSQSGRGVTTSAKISGLEIKDMRGNIRRIQIN